MRTNNVLGILFSNSFDHALPELTALRTMGSVPFGSRYRLIDFPLSGMVNFGITKVGVVTKGNYRSLMDHLGMGKAWDLSRKNEGLMLLPPFVGAGAGGNETRIEGLRSAGEFLANSKEEFVVMSDCNLVCNLDYRALMQEHLNSGAQLTIAYKNGVSLNTFVLRKALLERMVRECNDCGDFEHAAREISLRVHRAEITAYAKVIDNLQSYYDLNMELLQLNIQQALFDDARPVLTKIHDDMPAIYGLHAMAKNCLVADGCHIKGEVKNSVLFRGVVIEEGATVRNCVLMNGTYVSKDVTLDSVITDKAVTIKPGKTLMGAQNYPIYLGKKIVV